MPEKTKKWKNEFHERYNFVDQFDKTKLPALEKVKIDRGQ